MGQDKALLEIGGRSLLRRSVELLESLGLAQVVVSGNYPGFDCLADRYPQLGPLAGLHAGCQRFDGCYQGLLLLPVDMPLMGVTPLQRLLQQPAGGYYRQAHLPALVPLDGKLRQLIEARLGADGNNRSVVGLFEELALPVLAIPPEEQLQFSNSNTPDEWQACINALSS